MELNLKRKCKREENEKKPPAYFTNENLLKHV